MRERKSQCVIKELMSLYWLFLVLFYFPVVAQTTPKWQYWVSLERAATLWKESNVLVGFPLHFCSKALNLIAVFTKLDPAETVSNAGSEILRRSLHPAGRSPPDKQGEWIKQTGYKLDVLKQSIADLFAFFSLLTPVCRWRILTGPQHVISYD